jgi:hypothetical protein
MFESCRENTQDLYIYKNGVRIDTPCIWECAVGEGNLHKVLKERNYYALYSDLVDYGYGRFRGMYGQSFLDIDYTKKWNVGIILTNPPYSLSVEFILHALEILPENGIYVALMNLNTLAEKKRYEQVYRFGSLREVYVFSKRINCWKNNCKENTNLVNYAWFVFQKGYVGQPTLYWL